MCEKQYITKDTRKLQKVIFSDGRKILFHHNASEYVRRPLEKENEIWAINLLVHT